MKYPDYSSETQTESEKRYTKAVWITPVIHSELAAMADIKQQTMRVVVENLLKKGLRDVTERNG